jgi:hypothetical protein
LQDLTIDGSSAMSPPVAVVIVGPASVTIQSKTGTSTIKSATSDGVRADGPARVAINTTTIQNNGGTGVRARTGAIVLISSGTFMSNASGAVVAQQGSTVTLDAGSVESSAAPNVPAITALQSSTVTISANINTGPDNAPTVLADQNSSISIATPGSIQTSSMATAGPAIVAQKSSSVSVFGGSVTGPSANHTIAAFQGSSVFLRGTAIAASTLPVTPAIPFAVIAAAGSSSIVLAGGNDITNNAPIPLSCTGTTIASCPVAVLVADGSSLIQSNGALFGQMPAVDTVTGKGSVQTQSAIELAISPETGAGLGGITWNGNIGVAQSSTFRADGDNVMINGTLILGQAANAIFNNATGTTIDITSVVCQSTTDHVAGGTAVTPNVMMGVPPNCPAF